VPDPSNKALDLAYEAGRAAHTEPPERRHPDACPFPAGDPQREQWLAGFSDVLDEQPDPAELRRAVKAASA
jgi:ribosome modulation factor